MPGTRRTFTYSLTPDADDFDRVLKKAQRILGWACEGDHRVECHGITGEALGTITLNLTVVNRDRWAATQLAQDILNYVTWGVDTDINMDLGSLPPAPHEHRGYQFGRSKRFNEPKPPPPTEPVERVYNNQYTKKKWADPMD